MFDDMDLGIIQEKRNTVSSTLLPNLSDCNLVL